MHQAIPIKTSPIFHAYNRSDARLWHRTIAILPSSWRIASFFPFDSRLYLFPRVSRPCTLKPTTERATVDRGLLPSLPFLFLLSSWSESRKIEQPTEPLFPFYFNNFPIRLCSSLETKRRVCLFSIEVFAFLESSRTIQKFDVKSYSPLNSEVETRRP